MATASDEYIFYYDADYIQEGYYEQELYFEGDYLAAGYFEGEQVVQEAAADLVATAALTSEITVFVPAQADLAAEATQTTTETRIKQLDADFDALFSPNVQISVRKNAFAILDAVASTETAATLIADIDKTLESIVNLDLQAEKFTGIIETLPALAQLSADTERTRAATAQLNTESNLDIEFIVEFAANISSESTAFARPTVFQAKESAVALDFLRYNNFGSFSNDAAFNQAVITNSSSNSGDYREYSNIVFDGTDYVFLNEERFVLRSSDLVNWNTNSLDLSFLYGPRKLDYQDGYYLFQTDDRAALYSTDAITWVEDFPATGSGGNVNQKIIRNGDRWYIIRFQTKSEDRFVNASLDGEFTNDDLEDPNATFFDVNNFSIDGVQENHSDGQGAIHSVSDTLGFYSTPRLFLAVATDEKIKIVSVSSGFVSDTGDIFDPSGIINFFVFNNDLYIASKTTIYKSTDRGSSWTVEYSFDDAIIGATANSGGILVLTYGDYARFFVNNSEVQSNYLGLLEKTFNPVFSTVERAQDGRVFVIGDHGVILEFTGTDFDLVESPASWPLGQIHGDLSNAKQIDFFTKANHTSSAQILWSGTTFEITRSTTNDVAEQAYRFTFGGETTTINLQKTFDSYTHIKLLQDSLGTSVYIDGSRVINKNFTNPLFPSNTVNISKPDRDSVFLDELRISNQVDNSSNDATTSVPQSNQGNTESTLGLFKFDNTFEVEQGFSLLGSANLESVSAFEIDTTRTLDITANLESTAEITALPGVIKQYSAGLNAEFASAATATRLFALDSAQNAQFTFAADASITQNVSADLSASFAQTAEPLRIKQGLIDTDSVATALTAAGKVGQGLVTLEAFSTLGVLTQKRTGVVVNFESDSELAAEESRTRSTSAEFTNTLTLAATGDRIRFATPLLESEFATSVLELKILGLAATLEARAEASATTNGLFKASSTLEAQATLDTQSTAFNEVPATLAAEFDLASTSGNLLTAGATLLVSSVTIAATAREFVFLDELVYEIRGEDRTYRIPSEQRAYTILEEDRTWRIL